MPVRPTLTRLVFPLARPDRSRPDRPTVGSTVTADYTYDGLDRMAIRATANMSPAGTTHYLYDRAGRPLAEADSTGQTLREYVWLDDLPLAVVADVNTGSPSLYLVPQNSPATFIRSLTRNAAIQSG